MQPSRGTRTHKDSAQAAKEARATLRDQCRAALQEPNERAVSNDLLDLERPLSVVRETLARYVVAWRETQATPERMLIDLKTVLNEVTAPLDVEARRRVSEDIIGWSIEEYYSR